MKLFLSSQDFGNYPDRLLQLVGNKKKVLFINNAKDDLPLSERNESTEAKQQDFEALGFIFQELNLREYFDAILQENIFKEVGLVWFSGGNTFILRRALAYSGFDKLVVKMVKNEEIVFGGSSAGSIIATPALHGTENGDDPDRIPLGYKKEIIWEGLNLVDFHIVPHYLSDWFGAEANAMKEYFEKNITQYKALIDGQVVIIEGDKEEFLQ